MEKDNVIKNEAIDETKENEILDSETKETTDGVNEQEESESGNEETQELINNSSGKVILANALDQLLIIAGSSLLLLLIDFILRFFGYMFVRENGAIILAGVIIYFIINCVYVPILEKSKLESTIAKKILNMN